MKHILRKKFALLALLFLTSCTRPPLPSPEMAFREVAPPDVRDDLSLAGLTEALSNQQTALLASKDRKMTFGSYVISRGAYAAALAKLLSVLESGVASAEKYQYIKDNFRFVEIYGGERWGEVLLTGYFEPVLEGSAVATRRFSQALYGRPHDLLSVRVEEFAERFKGENLLKGRLVGDTVLPYYSRAEIDGPSKVLSGRGLELCYVDPIDAFFLHIQGSGTVRLPDGRELFITYADKNGRKYEAIGKFLRGKIAPAKVTMQRIERVLRAMTPPELLQALSLNPSYVFFKQSAERALTHLGVPATPARTIASDAKYVPKGALALLTFRKPIFSSPGTDDDELARIERVSRFVVDQDTGGAITGTDRIDLFVGRGDEAKQVAGILQDRARIVYLVPRNIPLG